MKLVLAALFCFPIFAMELDELELIQVFPAIQHKTQVDVSRDDTHLARKINKSGCSLCCAEMIIQQYRSSTNRASHFNLRQNARLSLKNKQKIGLTTESTNELIERHTGKLCKIIFGRLGFDQVKEYIDANKVICFSYDWIDEDFGHAMIISGYAESETQQWVLLNDPLRSEPLVLNFRNLISGRYDCEQEDKDLLLILTTDRVAKWTDSVILSDHSFGCFETNKENQVNNF